VKAETKLGRKAQFYIDCGLGEKTLEKKRTRHLLFGVGHFERGAQRRRKDTHLVGLEKTALGDLI
jgi:hypothetical protein